MTNFSNILKLDSDDAPAAQILDLFKFLESTNLCLDVDNRVMRIGSFITVHLVERSPQAWEYKLFDEALCRTVEAGNGHISARAALEASINRAQTMYPSLLPG